MLTVVCGENMASSRNYFQEVVESYKKKNYLIQQIVPSQIMEVYKDSEGVMNLFGQQKVYAITNLSTTYSKRAKAELAKIIDDLAKNKDLIILDWEEGKSAYELTSLKKIASTFQEIKPEKSIFQLLEACYPNNRKDFLHSLHVVNKTQEDTFIFIMLARQIRSLILAKEDALASNMSPWQKRNIMNQSKLWSTDKLVGFYEGLGRIDIALKTSGTPFSLKESLDILACYYL